jgi:putative transposase
MAQRAGYPSDLTDKQWELVRDSIPAGKTVGRPRSTDMREVVNAILYVLRNGCTWRALPHDLPKWQVVYAYFRKWQRNGVWQALNDRLREMVRVRAGRQAQPSAAIIDSQSVKTAGQGGPAATTLASVSKDESGTSQLIH